MICTICEGPVQVFGILGNTIHGQCRNCGIGSVHTCASSELAHEALEEAIEE